MQGIDAGVVIIAQGEEFTVLPREPVYANLLVGKHFPNMPRDINDVGLTLLGGGGLDIFGIDCMAGLNLSKVPYGYVQVRNLCTPSRANSE